MRYYDITMPIYNGMLSYPSDPPVVIEDYHSLSKNDSSNTSRLCLGSHCGTHIDAPKHFFMQGRSIDQLEPEHLIGDCQVVDVKEVRVIERDTCEEAVDKSIKRVLFKTVNSRYLHDPEFRFDYVGVSIDAAEWLVVNDFVLVGIDYLSIEPYRSEKSAVHTRLLSEGAIILEGVDLSDVDPGRYELICLPMSLRGLDGAPSRAFLRTDRFR